MGRRHSLLLYALLALLAAVVFVQRAESENVTCDLAVDTSLYYCRGWQDGVGKYGSRVRFIARIIGDDPGDDLGGAVAPLGDINADARDDFMVWVRNRCEWRIYYGDTLISKTPYLTWPKGNPTAPCGSTFPGNFWPLPDISGDGEPELVRQARGGSDLVEIYFAGAAFDTIPDLVISEPEFASAAGGKRSVSGGFDLNGDGQPDFVVGDPYYFQESPQRSGRVYAFWGGGILDSIPDLIFTDTSWVGQDQPSPPGGTLEIVPSISGDPLPDLVVGRPSTNLTEKDPPGRVYVYYGGAPIDTSRDLYFEGPDTGYAPYCGYLFANYFGGVVENIGDFNQDGHDDIFVSGGGCVPGYVYYGGPVFDGTVDIRTTSPWPREQDGNINDASPLGDVNGDGFPDFCTVLRGDEIYGGWVYIHYSSATQTGATDWVIAGDDWPATAGEFGRATVALGDVDGDGFDDFAIGTETTYFDPETNRGAVYIFAGYDPDVNSGVFDDPESPVPVTSKLIESVFPNPFNSATTIGLSNQGWDGTITIFDILGREVRSFDITGGILNVPWDGRNRHGQSVASGLYFAKAQSGSNSEVYKLVLVK